MMLCLIPLTGEALWWLLVGSQPLCSHLVSHELRSKLSAKLKMWRWDDSWIKPPPWLLWDRFPGIRSGRCFHFVNQACKADVKQLYAKWINNEILKSDEVSDQLLYSLDCKNLGEYFFIILCTFQVPYLEAFLAPYSFKFVSWPYVGQDTAQVTSPIRLVGLLWNNNEKMSHIQGCTD